MQKRTREKVALVVFALLVVLAAVVLTSYFATGRGWTTAASVVDDTVGQMKGYTALVYAGCAEPEDATLAEQAVVPEDPNVADSVGLGILALLPPLPGEDYQGVYVSDARDLYERKEAAVISVDVANPERYAMPCLLTGGGKRVGVFSVDAYTTRARLRQTREYLEGLGADAVVCIVPRLALLADPSAANVVVTTADDESRLRGRDQDGTFVVAAAPLDTVGVILFSPNNAPSAKVVDVL